MTRRVKTRGDSLIAALRSAVAELAQTDESKVEVTIEAPGFDAGTAGDVELRLELEDASSDDEDEDDELDDEERDDEERDDEGDDERDDARDHRRDARSSSDDDEEQTGITVEELDEEADAAADFLEGLLDAIQLPGDLQIRVHEDHAEVEIVNVGSGALIGRRGSTLEALQELVRSVLQRQFQRRSRVQIDIEGYRARRLERLLEKAESAIDEVLDTGEPVRLEPMDVFERKKIHHLVAEVDGVTSRSQGREPGRRVIIEPDES